MKQRSIKRLKVAGATERHKPKGMTIDFDQVEPVQQLYYPSVKSSVSSLESTSASARP